jgi:DNA-binding transcriptional MocR family regulator
MAKSLGPNKTKARYIKLESEWFESPAYRDLQSNSKCLLNEFINIFRPNRNGDLVLSVRDAAKLLNISVNTCSKAYHDLVEHGFLVLVDHEDWLNGKARTFEITVRGMGLKQPQNLWQRWQPDRPVDRLPEKSVRRPQNLGATILNIKTAAS